MSEPISPEEKAKRVLKALIQGNYAEADRIKDVDPAAFRAAIASNEPAALRAFCDAVVKGQLAAVKLFIEAGGLSPVNARHCPSFPCGAIGMAANAGQLEVLKYLIEERGVSPNSNVTLGMPIMHMAVLAWGQDNTRVIEYLLSKGVSVDAKGPGGRTPLFASIESGVCEVNELFLVGRGADVRVSADPENPMIKGHGRTHILALACIVGRSDKFLQALLDRGARADINRPLGDGATPLIAAILAGKEDAAKFLIQNGADPSLVCPADGMTALHAAAGSGSYEVCRALLELPGSNEWLDRGDKKGSTPLMVARQRGDARLVSLLRERGADPINGPMRAGAGERGQEPAGMQHGTPDPTGVPPAGSVCCVCGAGGHMKKCGGCKAIGIQVPYCSEECQRKDWKQHKKVCASRVKQ